MQKQVFRWPLAYIYIKQSQHFIQAGRRGTSGLPRASRLSRHRARHFSIHWLQLLLCFVYSSRASAAALRSLGLGGWKQEASTLVFGGIQLQLLHHHNSCLKDELRIPNRLINGHAACRIAIGSNTSTSHGFIHGEITHVKQR